MVTEAQTLLRPVWRSSVLLLHKTAALSELLTGVMRLTGREVSEISSRPTRHPTSPSKAPFFEIL